MMGEASEMYAVLLAGDGFGPLTLLDVKYLHSLIVRGGNEKVACIIEIQRSEMRVCPIGACRTGELLQGRQLQSFKHRRELLTFAGLYLETTSGTFC